MTSMHEFTIGTILVCLMSIVAYVLIRATVNMYSNKNDTGTFTPGIAGAMGEIDRIVRPSVENIVEAKEAAEIERTGMRALIRSIGILGTCLREAPEFASKRAHKGA